MRVSERLKQLRNGRPKYQVEEGAGISAGLLTKYEKPDGSPGAQRPNAKTVVKLAAFFGVHPTEIDPTVGDEPPPPERVVERVFDDYPSIAEALPVVRAHYPEWVAEAVRNHRRKGDEDPGRAYFVDLAREIYRDGQRAARDRSEIDELDERPDVSDAALDETMRTKRPRKTRQGAT